jgi:hypothetical protein
MVVVVGEQASLSTETVSMLTLFVAPTPHDNFLPLVSLSRGR